MTSFVDFQVEEYCLMDTFRPKCSSDEVIMITHAYYGAMRIGKCIETEFIGMHTIQLQYTWSTPDT